MQSKPKEQLKKTKQPNFCDVSVSNIINRRLRSQVEIIMSDSESSDEFIDADETMAMVSVGVEEPLNYRDAISGPEATQWKVAMQEEMDSLIGNGTWTLVKENNQKSTDCRWVFKKKVNVDGVVVRYKARLVARGFSQIYGVDYTETFSPVMRLQSFRIMMAVDEFLRCHDGIS